MIHFEFFESVEITYIGCDSALCITEYHQLVLRFWREVDLFLKMHLYQEHLLLWSWIQIFLSFASTLGKEDFAYKNSELGLYVLLILILDRRLQLRHFLAFLWVFCNKRRSDYS